LTTLRELDPMSKVRLFETIKKLAVDGNTSREAARVLRRMFPDLEFTMDTLRRKAADLDVTFAKSKSEPNSEQFDQPREFRELVIDEAPDGYRAIIVNDLQIPFQDKATVEAVSHFWDDFAPDLEVYNGDIFDFYNISSFDKNPTRRFKLQDELDESFGWMDSRAEANPNARRVFIEGNHEDRLRRFLWKFSSELSNLRALEFEELMHFEELGVENLKYMSVLDFLGYRIEHGYKSSASKAYPVNVSRYMAIATGSSGMCGHTHHFSTYAWTDANGSHSYIENGCLCLFNLEYAPFPNWQQAFTYGVVKNNKVHLVPVQIYPDGFRAEGEFYPRRG